MSSLVCLSVLPRLSVCLSVSVCFLVYFYVHCCRSLCAPLSISVCSAVDLSVPLNVDWSVPTLKSSQSVSRTVQFWFWCTWWNLYSLWHLHFLSFWTCCLFHSHTFYCFYICTPMSGMVELHCCLIVVICTGIRGCILVSLLITPPFFFTANFKVTKPDTCHCHLVIAAVADIINSHTL